MADGCHIEFRTMLTSPCWREMFAPNLVPVQRCNKGQAADNNCKTAFSLLGLCSRERSDDYNL